MPKSFINLSDVCGAMINRREISICSSEGRRKLFGFILGIQMEDGTGNCWNITVATSTGTEEIFCRSAG